MAAVENSPSRSRSPMLISPHNLLLTASSSSISAPPDSPLSDAPPPAGKCVPDSRCALQRQLKNADELIYFVETFIFDCDGVIWKGDKLIDGIPAILDMLRARGKRLVFVTNNSTKSRKQYGKKFESLGLDVSEEEIFSSSFAAAAYLQLISPRIRKAGCVSSGCGERRVLPLWYEGFSGNRGFFLAEIGRVTILLVERVR